MDARIWHAQATTAPASMPTPLTAEQCRALTSNERRRYLHDLQDSFERLLLPRAQTEPVQSGMDRILRKNARQRPGAKRMIMLDAPFATGKSTMIKDWAQGRHRDWLGEELSGDLPTWRPQPGMTADLVPVVYATLRSASKVKEVNAQILAFLGYPNEGVKRVTTTMVVSALFTHGVRLLIIDDVHMLTTRSVTGRETLDYLKFLNSELGEAGGSMLLVGADLKNGALHADPQITGRLQYFHLAPYEITTLPGKQAWQGFLKNAEQILLPYLPGAEPGVFAREHAGFIWRRTQGYVGDTATLLTEALLAALRADTTISREHLAAVTLTERAHHAEADLTAQASLLARRAG
jgi:hypothetical protein